MNDDFKREVQMRLLGKPMLEPLFTHVFDIPQRLNEYNPDLFVVFNHENKRYEIHSLESWNTYQATVPYRQLDARTIEYVKRNDLRVHGKEIFRRIERQEEQREWQMQKQYKNWIRDVAEETKSMFAKDAWTFGT